MRQLLLLVSTMLMAVIRLQGHILSAGSGSTFAYATLEMEHCHDMNKTEAIPLGINTIRYPTLHDAYSGGFIHVYLVTKEHGWKKVFAEDVAVTSTLD